ncbi:MAG: imidazoleglycerol-phosphate dehydratase HisB, partial [Bacteroidota bacterium]
LGSKGIYINDNTNLGTNEITVGENELASFIALETNDWEKIYQFLKMKERTASLTRNTNETQIKIEVNLDGNGQSDINTGIAFFDHMLDQIARHGQIDLDINVKGDLEVDEHHTIEDTAIALGEAFYKALGNKLGMERYGFCLPMDDCLAQVAIDFGGRNWLVWKADFKREMIGKMPTEMFYHFFKSFTDGAKCNLNIKAEGTNEHHKIEAIFKAFAKAIKMAVKRDAEKMILPSTKGML